MRALMVASFMVLAASASAHHPMNQKSEHAPARHQAIKALSEQQVADLGTGKGMGLARAAELNGYPGPLHALELADGLRLDASQMQQLRHLFESMKAEAIAAGHRVVESERALDQAFASKSITPAHLNTLTGEIGERQAALRAVHLKYHLTTAGVLTAEQVHKYNELRGYR